MASKGSSSVTHTSSVARKARVLFGVNLEKLGTKVYPQVILEMNVSPISRLVHGR